MSQRSKSLIPEENDDDDEEEKFKDIDTKEYLEDKKNNTTNDDNKNEQKDKDNKNEKKNNDDNNKLDAPDLKISIVPSDNEFNSTIIPRRKNGQFITFDTSKNIEQSEIQNVDLKLPIDDKSFDYSSAVDCDDIKIINFEGYIYKITKSNKRKKLYFKLVFRDLFFYKDKYSKMFIGFHHLADAIDNIIHFH